MIRALTDTLGPKHSESLERLTQLLAAIASQTKEQLTMGARTDDSGGGGSGADGNGQGAGATVTVR